MADKYKTKHELIEELTQMRERVSELESTETELKQAREALRESEIRFKAIHAHSPIGIVLRDHDGTVVHSNRSALDMVGLSPDVGVDELPWSNLFDDPFVPQEAKDCLAQGKSMRYEQEMPFDFAECQRLGLYRTEGA
ncbi:MAG: PAS domain S-box protein, partial [Chloroflexi bacterium]|nr:PAS domain S-box protein [Chloroflexota bacterium]